MIREDAIKKMLVINLAVVYATVQFVVTNMAGSLISIELQHEIYPPRIFWLYLITTAVMFPVMVRVMRRTVRSYLREIEPKLMKKEFFCMLTLSLLCFGLMAFYDSVISS